MIDYKYCSSRPKPKPPEPTAVLLEETVVESVLAGIAFVFCLASGWAVLALISFSFGG